MSLIIPKQVNNIKSKAFIQFTNMKARCSGVKSLQDKFKGNSLCQEWYDYYNWLNWANHQKGFLNEEDNGFVWAIDKDILKRGNKHYCPELCVFVPNTINQFFSLRLKEDRNSLLGAFKNTRCDTYHSRINIGLKVPKYLGSFPTEMASHEAYLDAKQEFGKELANKYNSSVDSRVIEVLSDFKRWYFS